MAMNTLKQIVVHAPPVAARSPPRHLVPLDGMAPLTRAES